MASNINATYPIQGRPTTASVRSNFAYAKSEIEALQTKTDSVINVKSYGAVGDGTTDDTAAIQAAIDAAETAGGGQLAFPPGTYSLTDTLTITESNVVLVGAGADTNHDIGTALEQAATVLLWSGAANGTMSRISPDSGATGQRISGCGVKKIAFNCNGADVGLEIQSHWFGQFSDLYFHEPVVCGIKTGVVALGLGEADDVQRNTFSRCSSRNSTEANGGLFVLDGNSALGANTSYNTFSQCDARVKDGDGFVLKNCDFNVFIGCRVVLGAGTGNAIVFHGGDTLADTARHNVFYAFGATTGAGILARGTETYTTASTNNAVWMIDSGNATALPTLGTGATCWYSTTENLHYRMGALQLAIGDNTTNVETGRDALGTESVRIRNNSGVHVLMEKGDGTQTWRFRVDPATGDIEIGAVDADTGDILLVCNSAKRLHIPSAHSVIGALTVTGYIEVKDATGTVRKLAVVS